MEGFMVKDNLKAVPYGIAIVDPRPDCNGQISSDQYWNLINKGDRFPTSGYIVTKAIDVTDNEALISFAEVDKDRKVYARFNTFTVKDKRLKSGYPLEVFAEYRDTSEIFIRVCNGRNGEKLGERTLAIQRPEYVPPKPKAIEQPQRARTSVAQKKSREEELRNKQEREEQESIRREEELRMQQEREAEVRKIQKEEKLAKARAELDSLVGLDSVKESINMLVSRLEYESARREALGNKISAIGCPRFVFNGNPGTGKTTVARLIGDICYGCGLLSKGHLVEVSRPDLIGEYVGETCNRTKDACDKAHGGVLFIDEAYSLIQKNENDFGKEAVSVLVKEMEDHRDDKVVIFAGYTGDMNELLDSNAGITSRITDTITFSDFTIEQLLQIADNMARKSDYTITPDGRKAFEYLINQRRIDRKFGNAREVRTILDKAISRKAVLYSQGVNESLTELTADDFGVDPSKSVEESAKDILKELDRLTGLGDVKKNVHQIISRAKYMMQEVNDGNLSADQLSLNMNLCFTGNPGTGKTTVARLYARLLHSIGLARSDKVYEFSRSDLVAPYTGQTALKTKAACEKCYGGVMFIDEAYSLIQSDNDTFGMEALAVLVKEMEDNRDKLVVIFAGYAREMNDFMERNSGLRSRISKFIEFPDYSEDELYMIFENQISQKNCVIDDDAAFEVKNRISELVMLKDRTFGNARDIRNLTEEIFNNMITRVVEEDLEGVERKHIIIDDVKGV